MDQRPNLPPCRRAGAPSRPRAALAIIATCLALALVGAACGSSQKNATGGASSGSPATLKPVNGGSIVVGINAESGGWAPSDYFWSDASNLVASSVMETLATPGADSGAKPWLAKSWIADDAFDRWVVKLQPNVTFQDGEPFDAAAVKLNL